MVDDTGTQRRLLGEKKWHTGEVPGFMPRSWNGRIPGRCVRGKQQQLPLSPFSPLE